MELAEEYGEIQGLDSEVLALSADDLSGAQTIVEKVGIPFPVLYDPEMGIIGKYGARKEGSKFSIPTTFVIDKDGIIRWKYVGSRYDRPETSVIMAQLRDVAN